MYKAKSHEHDEFELDEPTTQLDISKLFNGKYKLSVHTVEMSFVMSIEQSKVMSIKHHEREKTFKVPT